MAQFTIPAHMSYAWQWGGLWYTMTYADGKKLDSLYSGGHPHGPTHEEKIAIMRAAHWDTCRQGQTMHCRSPQIMASVNPGRKA